MKKLALLVLSLVAAVTVSNAQVCALKSNALYLGIGAVNLGAEFSVAPQWTIDVSGTAVIFSPWKNVGDLGLYLNGWDAVVEVVTTSAKLSMVTTSVLLLRLLASVKPKYSRPMVVVYWRMFRQLVLA